MRGVVLTDDELKVLEKRFGPDVRTMGAWNSDGTFGFCWISVTVVEQAADSIGDPRLTTAVSRLKDSAWDNGLFVGLLETFGRPLIERIIAVYRQETLALTRRTALGKKPPEAEWRSKGAAAG